MYKSAGATLTESEISGPAQSDAVAKGTEAGGGSNEDGSYPMGLTEDDFSTTNTNYNVTFDVTDGWLKIGTAVLNITVNGQITTHLKPRHPKNAIFTGR